jgi:hydroxymethylpyrimidine/phosphomethylpyrimidine kinase
MMKKVLSIAGSDPSSGAGIQVDLKVFQALGAYGMAVPAALTVQNSRGVFAVEPVSSPMLSKQIEALLSDIAPDAIKTGMLLTKQNVIAVAAAMRKYKIRNLVIDPVLRSSSGKALLQPAAVPSLKKELFPLARIITPNIPETETLTGIAIQSEQDMDLAAGILLDMGPDFVLIKGGHSEGAAVDTLYGGKTVLSFSTNRRKGDFHGTGCVLSAAITVFISRGLSVEKAVEKAKLRVDRMLKTARPLGKNRKSRYFFFEPSMSTI